MIYSIPYFIITIFLAYVYGLIPFIIARNRSQPIPMNPITPVLIGYAVLGLLSQWFLIGGAINGFSFVVVFFGALAAIWRYGDYYKIHAQNLLSWLQSLGKLVQISFGLILFILLYQSSLPTKINDMGGYYLQTIQWMQQFGVVKGLGNLHPSLGLGSAWHSLLCLTQLPSMQTAYQINATLLFAVILFLHFQFTQDQYEEENKLLQNRIYLAAFAIAFVPLSFLYLTAPSPDLPILVFIPLLFYWFRFEPKTLNTGILLLLACFLFATKPPALIAVSIAVLVVIMKEANSVWSFKQVAKKALAGLVIALVCLGPLVYKNYIQTGYPLYPSAFGASIGSNKLVLEGSNDNRSLQLMNSNDSLVDNNDIIANSSPIWQIPKDWNKAFRTGIVSWGINDSSNVKVFKTDLPASNSRLLRWLSRPGYKGFMNKMIGLNFILGSILFFFLKTWRDRIFLFLLLLIGLTEWSILSQYRLMLASAITLLGFNAAYAFTLVGRTKFGIKKGLFISKEKTYKNLMAPKVWIVIVLGIYMVMAFVPMSIFKSDSRNKSITQMDGFTPAFLIKPYTDYRTGTLETFEVDSITFHYYSDRGYTWNAPIPAVSLSNRQFLEQNFHYRLRAIGKTAKDGFYLESTLP